MTAHAPSKQRITREILLHAFVGPQQDTHETRLHGQLLDSVVERDVVPGDVLFRAGDDAQHVHFMTEGRVRLSRAGQVDWVYEGWWIIGTTDVLAGRKRARTATVETAMRTFSLPSEPWFSVMSDRPSALLESLAGFGRGAARLHGRLAPDGGFVDTRVGAKPIPIATLSQRVRALSAVPLLASLPAQVLLDLAVGAERRELSDAEPVFVVGVPHSDLVLVTRGRIDARKSDPELHASFGPGSLACGAVCFDDVDAAWSAVAAGPTEVLTVAAEDVFDRLEDHLGGMRALMATLALERERLCEELASRTGELIL